MSEWFHNGEQVVAVPIDDRAFQYGDGLFETVAIRHGEPRLWGYHLERLARGCEVLRIDAPDTVALRIWLDTALRDASADSAFCVAKIIVSSGVTQRGYGRPVPAAPSVHIGIFPAAPLSAESYRDGVETIRCNTTLAPGSVTAGIKSLNRVEQVLARSECLAAGAFEGLTLDAEGRLICGTMSNVFLVTRSSISTPSLSRCGVAGVMRRHVMDTLAQAGQHVAERDVTMRDMHRVDEVFLTNSQFGVLPVRRCDDQLWTVGAATRDVMELLSENGIAECRL